MSRLKGFIIYKNLNWLNELPAAQAVDLLRHCSGSELWAQQMTRLRPFRLVETLYEAAEANWFALAPAERISAFSAVSKAPSVRSFVGVGSSQQSVDNEVVLAKAGSELADAVRLYQERFGFIFVVCASGKDPDELLAICKARLGNSVETELQIAAEEHRKIIEIRLNRLLEQ